MAFLLWTYTWLVAVHGHLRMEATTRLQDEVLVSEVPSGATKKGSYSVCLLRNKIISIQPGVFHRLQFQSGSGWSRVRHHSGRFVESFEPFEPFEPFEFFQNRNFPYM